MPTTSERPTRLPSVEVIRVHTITGSHIEPPFQDAWDEPTKLAWQAAVVAHDTGLDISVYAGVRRQSARRWWRWAFRWRPVPGMYGVRIGSSTLTPMGFAAAWVFLSGFSVGVYRQKARGSR